MKLRGCGTAIITPFKQDGSVDETALRHLVEWQIQSGIDFLVPCGTTGETPTLTHDEWLRVIDTTIEVNAGRVPIMAGATSNNTREAVAKAKEVSSAPRRRLCTDRNAVLQQADAGRHLPALQGHRRGQREAADAVQHRGPHRHEHRDAHAAAAGGDREHRCGERSQRQHRADRRSVRHCAGAFPGFLGRRCDHAGRDRAGRSRHCVGVLERDSRARWRA